MNEEPWITEMHEKIASNQHGQEPPTDRRPAGSAVACVTAPALLALGGVAGAIQLEPETAVDRS